MQCSSYHQKEREQEKQQRISKQESEKFTYDDTFTPLGMGSFLLFGVFVNVILQEWSSSGEPYLEKKIFKKIKHQT